MADGGARRPRVLVLTPAADAVDFGVSWRPEFARIAAALAASGLEAQAHAVSDPVPPGASALPLLAWGYHLDPATWEARLAQWEADGVRLLNPAAALRWNVAKGYLCDLAEAGAPVVPTVAVDVADAGALAAARRRFGAETLVVKPQVGACAHGAEVLQPGQRARLAGPAILQPFCPSIAREGELSLIYFGGRFSHAVRKTPAHGDFRVQEEHGGLTVAIEPPAEALAAAQAALDRAPLGLIYARVDLVRMPDGRLGLMELELIEPQLFLALAPDGGAALGSATREHLARA